MKPLHTLDKTLGHFAVFVATKPVVVDEMFEHLPAVFVAKEQGKSKHDHDASSVFLMPLSVYY